MHDEHSQTGSCLCGGVTFATSGRLRDVWACHCGQCRKSSGHHWAATSADLDRFRVTSAATLAWYDSSPAARRGFCARCGASLFWKPAGEDRMAIAAGALDGATGLRLTRHIFTEDAGDYYRPEGPPSTRRPRRRTALIARACAATWPSACPAPPVGSRPAIAPSAASCRGTIRPRSTPTKARSPGTAGRRWGNMKPRRKAGADSALAADRAFGSGPQRVNSRSRRGRSPGKRAGGLPNTSSRDRRATITTSTTVCPVRPAGEGTEGRPQIRRLGTQA